MIRLASPAFLGALLGAALAVPATAGDTILALSAGGGLARFDSARRVAEPAVRITGIEGAVIGMDVRPADRKLYAVSDRDVIYTVDPATGAATRVVALQAPFAGGPKAVVDFNPQADRLRLMALGGRNLRVDVSNGAAAVDGTLRFADSDGNRGKSPTLLAGAYTNSFAGTKGTELFTLDTALDLLLLQSPPNDGVQQTKGRIGMDMGPGAAFDIVYDGDGGNVAYLLNAGRLHTLSLDTGRAKALGPVRGLGGDVIDIAVLPR